MPGLNTREQQIRRYTNQGDYRSSNDQLAVEAPLQLSIKQGHQQRQVSVSMRTPGQDKEMALGFLLTEGILPPDATPQKWNIKHVDKEGNHLVVELPEQMTIDWKRLSRQTYTSSSCGVCGKTSIDKVFTTIPWPEPLNDFSIDSELITALPDLLRKHQEMFAATGANHGCGIFTTTGKLEGFAEDVGRHNALDKIIGNFWMSKRIPIFDSILVLSGRASFELIQKTAMANIRFVVAVGAPSTLAVDLATELNITLCGFTKKQTFNAYCGFHRIS